MPLCDFRSCILKAEAMLERAKGDLAITRKLADQGDRIAAFNAAFTFAAQVERLALLARALPAYTGHPKAWDITEQMLRENIPVEMGFTAAGWFCLRIPTLLPKKESGSPSYIRDFLYPAMERFFSGKLPVCYADCVLIFRHIYDSARPERAFRDHDNIETNMVTDIVALYLLPDDTPLRCAHYYCSAVGKENRTEVYVVPCGQLPDWLVAAKKGDLEGVTLHETHP